MIDSWNWLTIGRLGLWQRFSLPWLHFLLGALQTLAPTVSGTFRLFLLNSGSEWRQESAIFIWSLVHSQNVFFPSPLYVQLLFFSLTFVLLSSCLFKNFFKTLFQPLTHSFTLSQIRSPALSFRCRHPHFTFFHFAHSRHLLDHSLVGLFGQLLCWQVWQRMRSAHLWYAGNVTAGFPELPVGLANTFVLNNEWGIQTLSPGKFHPL